MMNLNELDKTMSFAAIATGEEMTDSKLAVYAEMLKDYHQDDINQAFRLHLADPEFGAWFPKPANIIKHIELITAQRKQEQAKRQAARVRQLPSPHSFEYQIQQGAEKFKNMTQEQKAEYLKSVSKASEGFKLPKDYKDIEKAFNGCIGCQSVQDCVENGRCLNQNEVG